MARMEREYVQHMILFEAADIANRRFSLEYPSLITGEVFRADPVRSERGGMCLSIDQMLISTMTKDEIAELHHIGTQSVREALVTMQKQFIGLILGEARRGRNYFDDFIKPNEQTRLF